MSGYRTVVDYSASIFKTCGTNMKTYAELEREAYMAGDVELAKLYAKLADIEHELISRVYGGT